MRTLEDDCMTTVTVRQLPFSPHRCQLVSAHRLTMSAPRLAEVPIDGQITAPAPAARHVVPTKSNYAHVRAVCMHKSEHWRELLDA
jgi:hypothetical protein